MCREPSTIDVCNFSSFGIWFSFAVSCEKVYHCVFSHSSSTSNECYVSCCSQNSLWMARLRSISWCRHNDADFLFHLDLQCPFITAHTTDRDRSFLIAVFMLCMSLNDIKVVHTDWHAKIPGQFYNWIFSFKSALLENVELLSVSKFSTHNGTFDERSVRWNFESLVWFQEKIFCLTNQKCNLLCSNLLSMHLTLLNPLQTQ